MPADQWRLVHPAPSKPWFCPCFSIAVAIQPLPGARLTCKSPHTTASRTSQCSLVVPPAPAATMLRRGAADTDTASWGRGWGEAGGKGVVGGKGGSAASSARRVQSPTTPACLPPCAPQSVPVLHSHVKPEAVHVVVPTEAPGTPVALEALPLAPAVAAADRVAGMQDIARQTLGQPQVRAAAGSARVQAPRPAASAPSFCAGARRLLRTSANATSSPPSPAAPPCRLSRSSCPWRRPHLL